MKPRYFFLAAIFVIAACMIYFWKTRPHPVIPPAKEFKTVPVGLSDVESRTMHHIYQGTNLFPLAFIYSLKDQKTGEMMCETFENYGFILANKSQQNPYQLPVGIGGEVGDFLGMKTPQIGLNCSACHTGEIEYNGERFRIDGAPNMVDVEQWTLDTAANAQYLLDHKEEALAFLVRFLRFSHEESAPSIGQQLGLKRSSLDFLHRTFGKVKQLKKDPLEPTQKAHPLDIINEKFDDIHTRVTKESYTPPLTAPPDKLDEVGKALHSLEQILYILKGRIQLANKTVHALQRSPDAGPGRDDAWGLVELIVMNDTESLLTNPIVVPHLFNNSTYEWFHCDGNTNSVMDRNIAQGVALGADVEKDGVTTSLLPRKINQLDKLLRKISSPKWPDEFPEIDTELAKKGETIFNKKMIQVSDGVSRTCADCHTTPGGANKPVELIGTSPLRWDMFDNPNNGGPERLQKLADKVVKIKAATMKKHGVGEEEYSSWEINGPPEWKPTSGYMAHELKGIWASPPYLHNGSVRTLYQLMLPEEQREKEFYVGNRTLDPKEVGFVNKPGTTRFKLDTSKPYNSNKGHNFGKDMTDEERWALIEYLKSL